ncbi:hypothetical protein LJC60_00595 [Ruminococcaceae bacterium OttesenSCG-928-D13]|nr:hypothetical protein [Ruminococcaceae bacterium OttesenSCG-928-D13]MDL2293109.1 hypothetical protein [Ruminococcaceae bacterium OttesenSCG-928-D13]
MEVQPKIIKSATSDYQNASLYFFSISLRHGGDFHIVGKLEVGREELLRNEKRTSARSGVIPDSSIILFYFCSSFRGPAGPSGVTEGSGARAFLAIKKDPTGASYGPVEVSVFW